MIVVGIVALDLGALAMSSPMITQALPRRSGAIDEQYSCCGVRYGSVTDIASRRLRTITTTPAVARGRLPTVLFVPWLSCDSVAVPPGSGGDGWTRTLRGLIERLPGPAFRKKQNPCLAP